MMATTIGKLVVCDKCGKSVFLKRTAVLSEIDTEKFEAMPVGWVVTSFFLNGKTDVKTLCPDCFGVWEGWLKEEQTDGSGAK